MDELAAAAAQIFDNVGIPLQTDKIALSGTVCPIGTVSFQFNEPAGSSTVYDDQGVLAGTVSNPSYAIPGDGYFHGNENMDAYVELTNSAGCLLSIGYTGYLREITLEARIKPEVVDLDYLDADGNGIDDDFDFDKDPFTVLPGGRNSTQQRIFERQKTLQFTIMRGSSWAGDYVESRAGKARVMVKYRVPSQYRRDCGAEGAGAWWKQVSSDIDLYPSVAGHWYKIRVVFNSNKSNIPIDIWADHQGANGNGAGENWSGFINIAKPNPEDSGGCKWMSQPGDEILAENKLSYIGDNANHNDMPGASNNQRFKGLIDWLIWKPAADYSGVDSPPHESGRPQNAEPGYRQHGIVHEHRNLSKQPTKTGCPSNFN